MCFEESVIDTVVYSRNYVVRITVQYLVYTVSRAVRTNGGSHGRSWNSSKGLQQKMGGMTCLVNKASALLIILLNVYRWRCENKSLARKWAQGRLNPPPLHSGPLALCNYLCTKLGDLAMWGIPEFLPRAKIRLPLELDQSSTSCLHSCSKMAVCTISPDHVLIFLRYICPRLFRPNSNLMTQGVFCCCCNDNWNPMLLAATPDAGKERVFRVSPFPRKKLLRESEYQGMDAVWTRIGTTSFLGQNLLL